MFYRAIVEDNKDPLKLGRVRVRILGLHTDNRAEQDDYEYLPTNELPWAYPIYPVMSPTISGENFAFGVPEQGSIVAVIFKDKYYQEPYYIGTIPSIERQPDYKKGFSDPDKKYPKWQNESSISRLARHENIDKTIIPLKQVPLTKPVLFVEPVTVYNAKYPCNKVIETKSGHIIELDDTPGFERVHIWHRSGTNIEIYPNGKIVKKSKNDDVSIILGDMNIKITKSKNEEIDNHYYLQIEGDVKLNTNGNVIINSYNKEKEVYVNSKGKVSIISPDIEFAVEPVILNLPKQKIYEIIDGFKF